MRDVSAGPRATSSGSPSCTIGAASPLPAWWESWSSPRPTGDPVVQFDRTPYLVGFQAAGERFSLLTAHIRCGTAPVERIGELATFSRHVAKEIRDRARFPGAEEVNVVVLGDFNIDRHGSNALFDAFVDSGLWGPEELRDLPTTYGEEAKHDRLVP